MLAVSFTFCFLKPLDKNGQLSFYYLVKCYTSDLDWMIAIVFDNGEKMY